MAIYPIKVALITPTGEANSQGDLRGTSALVDDLDSAETGGSYAFRTDKQAVSAGVHVVMDKLKSVQILSTTEAELKAHRDKAAKLRAERLAAAAK